MAFLLPIGAAIAAMIAAATGAGFLIADIVETVRYNQQLAEEADQLRPKYSKYKETPQLLQRDVSLTTLGSFISSRPRDEQSLLNRLKHVATSGKERDYQFQFSRGVGACTGLLIVLAKSSDQAKIVIARMRIDYELENSRYGISTDHLNAVLEEYMKRQTALSLKEA